MVIKMTRIRKCKKCGDNFILSYWADGFENICGECHHEALAKYLNEPVDL